MCSEVFSVVGGHVMQLFLAKVWAFCFFKHSPIFFIFLEIHWVPQEKNENKNQSMSDFRV
jgi:hypothetical protein